MKISNKLDIKKGALLIAPPLTDDDYFHNSVVLLADYSNENIVGFILNKPLDFNISDLIDDFPNFKTTLYYGGPVATDNLYFLHRVPSKIENSIHIIGDLYWGGDFNQVKDLIQNNKLTNNEIRFFLGYSGWEINQLSNELKDNLWITDEFNTSLFECDVLEIWKKRLCEKKQDYKIWVNAPKDPSLN